MPWQRAPFDRISEKTLLVLPNVGRLEAVMGYQGSEVPHLPVLPEVSRQRLKAASFAKQRAMTTNIGLRWRDSRVLFWQIANPQMWAHAFRAKLGP